MFINNFLQALATHSYYFPIFIIGFILLTILTVCIGAYIGKESTYLYIFITLVATITFVFVSQDIISLLFNKKTIAIVHPHILKVIAILFPLSITQLTVIVFLLFTRKFFSARMFRYRANGISIYQDRVIGAGIALVAFIPTLFLSSNVALAFNLSANSGHFIDSVTTVITFGKVDSLSAAIKASAVYVEATDDDATWNMFLETILPEKIILDETYREGFVKNIDEYRKILSSQNFLNYLVENIDEIESEFELVGPEKNKYNITPLASLKESDFNIILSDKNKFEKNILKTSELTLSLKNLYAIFLPEGTSEEIIESSINNLINLYFI